MVNRRAVRGFPSIRHAAIRVWNAVSKGGTSCGNSSSVRLVKSRNSIGRDCRSVNRKPAMGRASCHYIVISRRIIPERKRDKLKRIRFVLGEEAPIVHRPASPQERIPGDLGHQEGAHRLRLGIEEGEERPIRFAFVRGGG